MGGVFVGRRARLGVGVSLFEGVRVYGASVIGDGCVVGPFVVVGFPARGGLLGVRGGGEEALDGVSRGARIGSGCVLRSFTVVYEDAVLGDGVETGHYVLIREGCVVGRGVRIGTGSVLDGGVRVGEGSVIQSRVYLPRGTVIGRRVFIGPGAVFANDKYPPSGRLEAPVVGDGAVIGAGAVVLPGVVIGEGAVVGAGAVVTRSVPPRVVVAGCPARPLYGRDVFEERRRVWEAGGGGR